MEGGRNIGVTKAQAIVLLSAGRLSTKSKPVEGAEKKVSTPVTREHSTGAIGSVGRRCQPQDQQVSRSGSERGDGFSPVGPVQKCASLFSSYLLTVLDQTWAKSALDSFPLNSAQFQTVSFSGAQIQDEHDGYSQCKEHQLQQRISDFILLVELRNEIRSGNIDKCSG